MFPLILVLCIQAAYSLDCTNGNDAPKIVPEEIHNPSEIVGNWSYVYHWDNTIKYDKEVYKDEKREHLACPFVDIAPVSPDVVENKKSECAAVKEHPFQWEDAKLILNAPLMDIENGIIFMGENENWLLADCDKVIKMQIKKVTEDYIAVMNPDTGLNTELLSRDPATFEQFTCVARNVDFGLSLRGIAVCY